MLCIGSAETFSISISPPFGIDFPSNRRALNGCLWEDAICAKELWKQNLYNKRERTDFDLISSLYFYEL